MNILTLTPKNLTKSPKHAARGVAQSPYPIYSHGKAYLSKQLPWCAAGDPRLASGRFRAARAFFHPPFGRFSHLPHHPCESVRVNEYERNSFPTQNVTIKLRQHKSTPAQQIPGHKKSGNVPAQNSNPRPSACKADVQTITPPAPRGYTAVKLMYLWIKLGVHGEHYKHHNTLDTDT